MEGCSNCIYSYYRHYYKDEPWEGDGTYHCDQHETDVAETDQCSDYIGRGELNEYGEKM